MDVHEELLGRFARTIDLPAFMWQRGFRPSEAREPGQLRMSHPTTGDSLVLEKNPQRGWTYAPADRPMERGSIVDYLVQCEGVSRRDCLERLFACVDERGTRSEEAARYRAVLRERPAALEGARREYDQALAAEYAARRVLERCGVPGGAIDEARFGRARSEEDAMKLTSEPRTLWASRYRPSDTAIVFVERPIDAIAYERTRGNQTVCYIATGSTPDADQLKRLEHILTELPDRVAVVLAFGGDRTGRKLAEQVRELAPSIRMEEQAPLLGACWADQMQLETRHALALQRVNRGVSR